MAQAANFYQANGFIHGQAKIRAADPARTRILGNFRFDYKASPLKCEEYPWYDHIFAKAHTQIECDPSVWKQAECSDPVEPAQAHRKGTETPAESASR